MSEKLIKVYLLTLPSGKSYVGATVMSVSRRVSRHRLHNLKIGVALRRYKTYKWKILHECHSQIEALNKERHWIIKLKTLWPSGYNMRLGGNGAKIGHKSSNKVRINMKRTITKLWRTKQFKALRVAAVKEQWKNPKFRKMRSDSQSKLMKRLWKDPAYLAKMRARNTRRKHVSR